MGKYKKLVGNSAVFAAGNLGSKLISFIMVPLYTYYLTTQEYGTVELITTTISLLLPMVSFGIGVGVLRYALEKDIDNAIVVSNSIALTLGSLLIGIIITPFLKMIGLFEGSVTLFAFLLLLQILTQVMAQFARGNGQVKVFALNGMIKTFTIGLANICLLMYFHLGLNGYLLSLIIAEIVSLLYLTLTTPYFKLFSFNLINKSFMKELIYFSLPTIPNDVLWWFVNSSSRYFILFLMGISYNGIYAVASKIPSLISMMQSVFSQAWQISLVDERESKNREAFHETTFKYYAFLLFFCASSVMVVLKFFIRHFVADAYYISWTVTPLLLLSSIYSAFIGFYGQFYIAEKKTRGLMNTSIVSGVISIILNYVCISLFGLIGVGIAAMVSLFVGWLIRIYDTRKFIKFSVNVKTLVSYHIVIFMQIVLIFLFDNFKLIVLEFLIWLIFLFVNKDLIISFFKTIIRKEK